MTASRRGLAILTAIAVVLALILVLAPAPGPEGGPRQALPGLAVDDVRRIVLRRPAASIELVRGDRGWTVVAPAAGPADGPAVADLLSSLAVARWDRIVRSPDIAGSGLDRPRLVAELDTGRRTVRIAIGAAIAATAQAWIRVDDGAAMLVPGWLAAAVDRDLGSLRQRRLAPVLPAQVTGVEIHGRGADLVLAGTPLAVRGDGWTALAAPEPVAALLTAITGLAAVDFPATDAGPATDAAAATDADAAGDGLSVRVLGGTAVVDLVERGVCTGGRARVDGSAGAVCVEAAAWALVAERAAVAGRDGAAWVPWVDPRPIDPDLVSELVLRRRGVTLRRRGGTVAVVDGDREQPAEAGVASGLFAALAAPARRVVATAGGGGEPVVEARRSDGSSTVLHAVRVADGIAVRRGSEPFALVLAAGAAAMLDLGADQLRTRSLIADEASALARLDIAAGGRRWSIGRGAVLGEWTAAVADGGPAVAVDPAVVDTAAATLADLAAARFVAGAEVGPTPVRIEASFDPPPVAGAVGGHHVVELGADRGAGCGARVDGTAVALDAPACRSLRALLPRSR